jgi:hypothetical protein
MAKTKNSDTKSPHPAEVGAQEEAFSEATCGQEVVYCVFRPKSTPIPLANRHAFRLKSALVPMQIGTPVRVR